MVNTKGISDKLTDIHDRINAIEHSETSKLIQRTALNIANVLGNDKNLYIDESTLSKIKKINTKLSPEGISKDIFEQIETLKNSITAMKDSKNAANEIGKKQEKINQLKSIAGEDGTGSSSLKARREEYTAFQEYGEYFNLDKKIEKVGINIAATPHTIENNEQDLQNIFEKSGISKHIDKRKLCDKEGNPIRYNEEKKYYELELPKKDKSMEKVKVYGIKLEGTPPKFTIDEDFRIEPSTDIDFQESIQLSISGIYKNVSDTDVNITHNKKFLLDINDGVSKTLEKNDIEKLCSEYNIGQDIKYFYTHNYKGLEQEIVANISAIKDHPDKKNIIKDIFKTTGIISKKMVSSPQDDEFLKFFSSYIIQNTSKKDYSNKEKIFDYLKKNSKTITKKFFEETINTKLREDQADSISLYQKIIQQVNKIEKKNKETNRLIKKNKKIDPDDTTDILVGNVDKVFIDDLTKAEEANTKRGKYRIESEAGYQRRMKARARRRAKKLIRTQRFTLKGSNFDDAQLAVERTKREHELLEQLGVNQAKIPQIDSARHFTIIDNIAQEFIKNNGTYKEATQKKFQDAIEKLEITSNIDEIKSGDNRFISQFKKTKNTINNANSKLISDNFIKTLESKIDEKNILEEIIKNKDTIEESVENIKNKILSYQEKYDGKLPAFFNKLPLHDNWKDKFNPENKNFLNNIIKLAEHSTKLNELKKNIKNTKIKINYASEIQRANTVEVKVNNFLEKRLLKSGRSKLATIAGTTAISSVMATALAGLGILGVGTMAPPILFSMVLAFFQKRGMHKKTINEIQNKYNNMGIEEREEYIDEMMKENKQLTPGQITQSFRYEVKDLKEKLEKLVNEKDLNDSKAIEMRDILSTAITLKYCQHQYGVTELGGNNEKDYHGLMKNIMTGMERFKHYAISADKYSKTKLGIKPDVKATELNAKYYLKHRTRLQEEIRDTASGTQKNIADVARKRGIKDAIVTGGINGIAGYLLSGISYGFSGDIVQQTSTDISKTLTSGGSASAEIITETKNIRTPLDLINPIRKGIK